MRFIVALILLSCSNFIGNGQNAGLVVQTGLTMGYPKDGAILSNGAANYGLMVGADARILDGGMYFIIGGQYHALSLTPNKSPEFFNNNNWRVVMGRFGVGFSVAQLNSNTWLRSKILCSMNFNIDYPTGALNIPDYTTMNDTFLGLTTGIGLTKGIYDLDLEYQYGLVNAYYEKPKTKFDFWTLMIGINF